MVRAAAAIWFGFAALMLLVLTLQVIDERDGGTMLLAGTFALAGGWIGWSLWRGPSFAVVLISLCIAAFVVFLWLIALVGGSSSPWSLLIPLGPAAAAVLTLMSRATGSSETREQAQDGE